MNTQGHERIRKTIAVSQQKHLENWWVLGGLLNVYKELLLPWNMGGIGSVENSIGRTFC